MRAKHVLIGVVIGVLLSSAVAVLAGNLDPPSGPTDAASQMYTLEQIYDRLSDGTAATKMTSFTEPLAGPGTGTMHTLNDIYDMIGERAPVPRTGVTETLASGDDGDLEKGIVWPNPRFTVHDSDTPGYANDDTVTDNLTGLMWTKNANHGQMKWYDPPINSSLDLGDSSAPGGYDGWRMPNSTEYPALAYCNDLELGGYDDWRLPNVRELYSLIDFSQNSPALPSGHPFTDVQSNYYWSSTTLAVNTGYAWRVYLEFGSVRDVDKSNLYYVWPVRGGQ